MNEKPGLDPSRRTELFIFVSPGERACILKDDEPLDERKLAKIAEYL